MLELQISDLIFDTTLSQLQVDSPNQSQHTWPLGSESCLNRTPQPQFPITMADSELGQTVISLFMRVCIHIHQWGAKAVSTSISTPSMDMISLISGGLGAHPSAHNPKEPSIEQGSNYHSLGNQGVPRWSGKEYSFNKWFAPPEARATPFQHRDQAQGLAASHL